MAAWSVYLLECADQSLYCGVTIDLESRLLKHNQGTASRYTRARRPVTLAAVRENLEKSAAFKLEYQIKQLPADRKIAALNSPGTGATHVP
jgi:putative endonuclease